MNDFGVDAQSAAREIKKRMRGLDPFIEVDGGQNREHARQSIEAGAAAKARHRRVEAVGAGDDGLDGVGVRELHIVVSVDADVLAGALETSEEAHHDVVHLLGIKRTIGIHDVDGIDRALGGRSQSILELAILHR